MTTRKHNGATSHEHPHIESETIPEVLLPELPEGAVVFTADEAMIIQRALEVLPIQGTVGQAREIANLLNLISGIQHKLKNAFPTSQ